MPLTYRLVSQFEETPTVGSGNWNKVTVLIPNSTYILSKVELVNNQLSIVFDFSDANSYQPIPFSFLLSGFGINTSSLTDNTNYLVVGVQNPTDAERENSTNSFVDWFGKPDYLQKIQRLAKQQHSQEVQDHRCPPFCPFS